MIMNYLTNAVRFTAEGEIVVEVSRRGGALRFEVGETLGACIVCFCVAACSCEWWYHLNGLKGN